MNSIFSNESLKVRVLHFILIQLNECVCVYILVEFSERANQIDLFTKHILQKATSTGLSVTELCIRS